MADCGVSDHYIRIPVGDVARLWLVNSSCRRCSHHPCRLGCSGCCWRPYPAAPVHRKTPSKCFIHLIVFFYFHVLACIELVKSYNQIIYCSFLIYKCWNPIQVYNWLTQKTKLNRLSRKKWQDGIFNVISTSVSRDEGETHWLQVRGKCDDRTKNEENESRMKWWSTTYLAQWKIN